MTNLHRNILATAACVLLSGILVACGGEGGSDEGTDAKDTTATETDASTDTQTDDTQQEMPDNIDPRYKPVDGSMTVKVGDETLDQTLRLHKLAGILNYRVSDASGENKFELQCSMNEGTTGEFPARKGATMAYWQGDTRYGASINKCTIDIQTYSGGTFTADFNGVVASAAADASFDFKGSITEASY
jgi:hypothetical protein